MKYLKTSLLPKASLFFFWLLHYLPLPILRGVGRVLGGAFFILGRRRRRVARVNLCLCFPDWDEGRREKLLRRHFVLLAQSFIDRSLLWWASETRLKRLITLEGYQHFETHKNAPILFLAPHFLGLDAGGVALGMEISGVSIYSRQKNPVFDAAFLAGRRRFRPQVLLSRKDGVRKALKAIKEGKPFYYLPDMDFGRKDAIFAPFFGIPAATITGLSRLARASRARVIPCIARMTPQGYTVTLFPPWENFPGAADVEEDTVRMNRFIEEQVLAMPEQYYWVHRRFKTRPEGEPDVY